MAKFCRKVRIRPVVAILSIEKKNRAFPKRHFFHAVKTIFICGPLTVVYQVPKPILIVQHAVFGARMKEVII